MCDVCFSVCVTLLLQTYTCLHVCSSTANSSVPCCSPTVSVCGMSASALLHVMHMPMSLSWKCQFWSCTFNVRGFERKSVLLIRMWDVVNPPFSEPVNVKSMFVITNAQDGRPDCNWEFPYIFLIYHAFVLCTEPSCKTTHKAWCSCLMATVFLFLPVHNASLLHVSLANSLLILFILHKTRIKWNRYA
jgi:hypothetical protein